MALCAALVHGANTMNELRDESERHLRALAGDDANLREDQWIAIRALVSEHKRALVLRFVMIAVSATISSFPEFFYCQG